MLLDLFKPASCQRALLRAARHVKAAFATPSHLFEKVWHSIAHRQATVLAPAGDNAGCLVSAASLNVCKQGGGFLPSD